MSTDPKNEKFTAFEFGINSRSNDGTMAAKFNVYSTNGVIELLQELLKMLMEMKTLSISLVSTRIILVLNLNFLRS